MKSFKAGLGYTAAAAVMSIAHAVPATAQNANAATITRDGFCGGSVPTASGGLGTFISTSDSLSVRTNAGIVTLTCHFDIPDGLEPARTTRATGFLCGTYYGPTHDSRMTATPGGTAILICRIRK